MEEERTDFGRQLAQQGASSSARNRSVATAMRADLRDLLKEVERVVTRAFEGLDQLDGAGEVMAEYVIDLAVDTPPS